MRRVVASLAAVLALGLPACGDDGAEPGASSEATLPSHAATLVLDFTPNAVHSGIYAAVDDGSFDDAGVDLTIREPGATTDAPELLAAGRAEFAVMDIQDLAIARERGLDLVGVAQLVDHPLAAVIAAGDIGEPAELEGGRVGVTGLPSDDAVLDTVLAGSGLAPDSVDRVTIGFQAVAALAAGRVDAATAFRNAEGVELDRQGVPVNVFGVEDFGAPPFPELVVATTRELMRDEPDLVQGVAAAVYAGSEAVNADSEAGLDALLAANPDLDRDSQEAQLRTLAGSLGGHFDSEVLKDWMRWAVAHGIVEEPEPIGRAFALG
jgi:NitT/TauT family transport system substrate-binding protein/putative hydroxymethylpyrimidine transport system substrate-binding protein